MESPVKQIVKTFYVIHYINLRALIDKKYISTYISLFKYAAYYIPVYTSIIYDILWPESLLQECYL
jgi:hypothetical protein